MNPEQSSKLRAAAVAFGIKAAKQQFDGRSGHGGSRRVVQRHYDETQVAALAGAAFEAGAEYALREMANENRRLREALLKVTRFIQPSMHARNWEAAETLDEARAILAELGERA